MVDVVTVAVTMHVTKPMVEAMGERRDIVVQVHGGRRRMDVKMIECVVARIDGASETAGRDQRKRRVHRNWDRHWYRHGHRMSYRNWIRLPHGHRDRLFHGDRHRLRIGKMFRLITI